MTHTIDEAVAILRAGGLVAFPTETVYGLGADAGNPEAVRKIFVAKGRPAEHPLIVHLASAKQLPEWAIEVPESAYKLAAAFWPGPLTVILKRAGRVPNAVTGGQETVGLRVPAHPLALRLLRAFKGGLAAPSANRFGRLSPTTAEHVRQELGDRVDLILDGGPCPVGLESTIVDLSSSTPRLLRPGGITVAQLSEVLGIAPEAGGRDAPRASGTLKSHYAPSTPARLLDLGDIIKHLSQSATNAKLGVLAYHPQPAGLASVVWRALPAEPVAYGRRLYAALRELDALSCDELLIEAVPDEPAWLAVADRLRRATTREV
jgi:L-threonylcarbamoyladenylate synthase